MSSSTLSNLINIAYEFSYDYDLTSSSGSNGLEGLLGGALIVPGIIALIVIISMWKIYTKAGKPGWASIIPIYNIIVLIQIAGLSMMYLLFFFVPILNIYAIFKIYIEVAHKFGKSTGFGVGMIFLNIIFMPMLAFGSATYEGNSNPSMSNNNNNYNNNFNSNNNYNNQMNTNQPTMGFDPQTGQPITGYNPQNGQPIYGNQNQTQTNTFVDNSMNQPTTNTFVDNGMNQPSTNTFVDNSMINNANNQVAAEPVQNSFVAPTEPTVPTTPVEPVNNVTAPSIDRPDATPVNDVNNIQ